MRYSRINVDLGASARCPFTLHVVLHDDGLETLRVQQPLLDVEHGVRKGRDMHAQGLPNVVVQHDVQEGHSRSHQVEARNAGVLHRVIIELAAKQGTQSEVGDVAVARRRAARRACRAARLPSPLDIADLDCVLVTLAINDHPMEHACDAVLPINVDLVRARDALHLHVVLHDDGLETLRVQQLLLDVADEAASYSMFAFAIVPPAFKKLLLEHPIEGWSSAGYLPPCARSI